MPTWVAVYGVAVSLSSVVAVLLMGRITKRQRQAINAMHQVMMATALGASNMWDVLTPEQIRSLHPNTVEVGNGLPKWDEVGEMLDQLHFKMRSGTVNGD